MAETYASSVQALVNGTVQTVPIRDTSKAPAIVETLTGETVSIQDSSNNPLQGLKIFGKTTQASAPSTGSPQDLENAGADGTIQIFVFNWNLAYPYIKGYISNNDGSITTVPIGRSTDYIPIGMNTKLYFQAFSYESSYIFRVGFYDKNKIWLSNKNINNEGLQEIDIPKDTCYLRISFLDGTQPMASFSQFSNYITSDYKTVQITVTNGLPGIPVSSGGNYTDTSGQKYYSDIYDAINGKYYHYTALIQSYNGEDVGSIWMSTTGELSTGATVLYGLTTPTVDDVPSFQASSNYPITNIFTDSTPQAGISASYVADTQTYIENKISQAVAIAQS